MKKDKIIEVEWVDSTSNDSWKTIEKHTQDTMIKCRTVGYLNRNDDEMVQVVQSKSDENHAMASLMIPKKCVTRIRKLK